MSVVPFSAAGKTRSGVGVCAPPGGCQGAEVPNSDTYVFDADISGVLIGAELTLTWSAASPASEELILGIAYETEEGNADWILVRGTSPLTLSEASLAIPSEKVIGIYANGYECQGQLVVFGCASVEQDFTIEGSLTTLSSV